MEMTRVKDALWPEVVGVGALMAVSVVAATQDAVAADAAADAGETIPRPKWQILATGAGLLGGTYMVAKNKMPDMGKGLLYGGVGIIAGNLGRKLYEQIKETPEGTPQSMLALIPTASTRTLVRTNNIDSRVSAATIKKLMPGIISSPTGVPITSSAEVLV